MNEWYSVKIIFESTIKGDCSYVPIVEESIRILLASDRKDAERKAACRIGKENEHSYKNDQDEDVFWRFIKVVEVQSLCTEMIEDGMEVFSLMYKKQEK